MLADNLRILLPIPLASAAQIVTQVLAPDGQDQPAGYTIFWTVFGLGY